jgi:hypothetical protein
MQGMHMVRDSGKHAIRFIRALLTSMLCLPLTAAMAAEVYTWTDSEGVIHFSDRQPQNRDAQTLDIGEVYRPGTTDAYRSAGQKAELPSPEAGGETLSPAEQLRLQLAEQRAERREEQAEKELWCDRYRERLARLEPARRVYYTNEQGEEVRMDDNQRMELIEESKKFISENCN